MLQECRFHATSNRVALMSICRFPTPDGRSQLGLAQFQPGCWQAARFIAFVGPTGRRQVDHAQSDQWRPDPAQQPSDVQAVKGRPVNGIDPCAWASSSRLMLCFPGHARDRQRRAGPALPREPTETEAYECAQAVACHGRFREDSTDRYPRQFSGGMRKARPPWPKPSSTVPNILLTGRAHSPRSMSRPACNDAGRVASPVRHDAGVGRVRHPRS